MAKKALGPKAPPCRLPQNRRSGSRCPRRTFPPSAPRAGSPVPSPGSPPPGPPGQGTGPRAAAADHQPGRGREGLAKSPALWQRSQRTAAPAQPFLPRCPSSRLLSRWGSPPSTEARAAFRKNSVLTFRPPMADRLQYPPPMARALSEIVKQCSAHSGRPRQPALKPAFGTIVPAGRIPRRQPVIRLTTG